MSDADQSGFNLGDGAAKPYVVLARKYRPESFKDLIGQEAMVQTLRNAFAADRIAQGYMLTGVRGVGKTTTARILARALNYAKPGEPGRPTVEFDDYGEHCREIIASRHPDVIEMDAASNTGVDNIREIIESARYRPLSARYKVYIIDEVHMLSKGAFNALLKTLEEPPGHVKFIFATTEVRKVPVTVLSRCQRFDLRRVEVPVLSAHFARIAANEGATADEDALRLIARAAEGSVRDGLSILDQAIAMGSGNVTSDDVRAMLGLADRGRVFDILEALMRGDTPATLTAFDDLHRAGADPVQILIDLAETVHLTTRIKAAGADLGGDALPAEDRRRAGALADTLSIPILSRAWQMLAKGIDEAGRAPNQLTAAEMVLIRIAHTADLPTPDELIRAMGGAPTRDSVAGSAPQPGNGGGGPTGHLRAHGGNGSVAVTVVAGGAAPAQAPRQAPASAPAARAEIPGPATFEELIELASQHRDAMLKMHLEDNVSLVAFEPGHIEIRPHEHAPRNLAGELGEKLSKWTGARWIVTVSNKPGATPVGEVRRAARAAEIAAIERHPSIAALLEEFPDAKILDVRPLQSPDGDDT